MTTLLVLVGVASLSWWLLGLLRSFLLHREIVDTPNERTIHHGSVPRGGGLVIVACLLVCVLVMVFWSSRPQTFIALAALILAWAGLSWWDDRVQLSPHRRFSCQALFALATVLLFGYVADVQYSSSGVTTLGWFGGIVTLVGLLWLSNLYNFMDGMDGLAASQTIVAAITLGFWLSALGDSALALCCWVLAASSYGFLLRNWHPASIFMGDVGSIAIGAFFGVMIVYLNTRYHVPVLCLVLVFGVFVADASVTIMRRVFKGEKIWLPHRSHFYQRLAIAGFNHAHIVLVYTGLMIVCAILASLAFAWHDRILLMCIIAAAGLLVGMVLVTFAETRIKHSQN